MPLVDAQTKLEYTTNALSFALFRYVTFLKENPDVMTKYSMIFDFDGLLQKCDDQNYTVYDFLVDCKFFITVTNSDMSKEEISKWTIPGNREGANVEDLMGWLWRMQFQNQQDYVENMSKFKMISIIERGSRHFGVNLRTSALSVSSRGNPYIVNLF